MYTPRPTPLLSVAATLLLLGCSDAPHRPATGNEPVLAADGMPSISRVASAAVLETMTLEVGQRDWIPLDAVVKTPEDALGAKAVARHGLTGVHLAPSAGQPPKIVIERLSWKADEVGAIAVHAAVESNGDARLLFRTDADEKRFHDQAPGSKGAPFGVFPRENMVQTGTSWGYRPTELVFDVAAHPAWTGTVTAIRLELLQDSGSVLVERIETRGHGIVPGPSQRVVDGVPQDAGLITLEWEDAADPAQARHEARRSYPSLAGEDQVVRRLTGGAMVVSYALPSSHRNLSGPVRFEILDEAGGPPLFTDELEPAADGGRWFHANIPAGDEGSSFVLRASGGTRDGRVNGLWGPICADPVKQRATSVVLITADTLRADHVGTYGAESVATPVIDALGLRGAAFLDALSTSNATSPSHASILTGLYPRDHRVTSNSKMLPEEIVSLAERMRESGRVTIASTAVRHLNSDLSGLGQGFDFFLNTPASALLPSGKVREPYRSAADSNRALIDTMRAVGDAPFFLWIHYYDPHTPYHPEPSYAADYAVEPDPTDNGIELLAQFARNRVQHAIELGHRAAAKGLDVETAVEQFLETSPHLAFLAGETSTEHVRAMYRAEVAQLDRDIGELFEALELDAPRDDVLVVLTADHGEGLGERDIWFDHEGLYTNTLHVPLILAGPGVPSNARITTPTSLVDVVPTICELIDIASPTPIAGVSLVSALQGDGDSDRLRWFQYASEQEVGFRSADHHFILSLRPHKRGALDELVEVDATELYDLDADPALHTDVTAAAPDEAQRAESLTRDWLKRRLIDAEDRRALLNSADREALGALGYADDE